MHHKWQSRQLMQTVWLSTPSGRLSLSVCILCFIFVSVPPSLSLSLSSSLPKTTWPISRWLPWVPAVSSSLGLFCREGNSNHVHFQNQVFQPSSALTFGTRCVILAQLEVYLHRLKSNKWQKSTKLCGILCAGRGKLSLPIYKYKTIMTISKIYVDYVRKRVKMKLWNTSYVCTCSVRLKGGCNLEKKSSIIDKSFSGRLINLPNGVQ